MLRRKADLIPRSARRPSSACPRGEITFPVVVASKRTPSGSRCSPEHAVECPCSLCVPPLSLSHFQEVTNSASLSLFSALTDTAILHKPLIATAHMPWDCWIATDLTSSQATNVHFPTHRHVCQAFFRSAVLSKRSFVPEMPSRKTNVSWPLPIRSFASCPQV